MKLPDVERGCRELAADPRYVVTRDPIFHDSQLGIYRPPGLWVVYDIRRIDPYAIGAPLLWYFPVPWHPLEVLATDFFGVKKSAGPLDEDEWEQIKSADRKRYGGWVNYTRDLAEALKITPEECRLLYHVFTPLRTNGCEEETAALVRRARVAVYSWFGESAEGVDGEESIREAVDSFRRMSFWGTETTEETARCLFKS